MLILYVITTKAINKHMLHSWYEIEHNTLLYKQADKLLIQ